MKKVEDKGVIRIVYFLHTQSFGNMTGSSPQVVVEMILCNNVIPPVISIKMLLTWKDQPATHTSSDLGGHSAYGSTLLEHFCYLFVLLVF